MTFDETIEKFEQEANHYNGLVPMETVYELILDLRDEYAPIIEMTKEQDNYLKSLTTEVSNEFNEEELPADGSIKITDKMIELEDSYLPLRYLNAVLHPETVKVVDE